ERLVKRIGFEPVIPYERDLAARAKDPKAFGPRCLDCKPVERLCGGDKIDREVLKRNPFGRSVDAPVASKRAQETIRSLAHGVVGFHGYDRVAAHKQAMRKKTRASTDIRDKGTWPRLTRELELVEQRIGVVRSGGHIVGNLA